MFKNGFVVSLILVGLLAFGCYCEHNYTRENCEIIQICDGIATFEDKRGNRWDWKIEQNEYFEVGEVVDLRMNDNSSVDNIEDDVIRKVVFKS